ncbi:MAG: hypothetical protein IPK83_16610 [Planctomycetes bacterium]|nr:hypothetical protein [Planctomycetota bacterium]
MQLRFDFAKDDCFGFTGWFVDDVRIFGCLSSGDCDANGIPDEIDVNLGGGPTVLLRQVPNNSSGSLSDADPHPTLGVNTLAENFDLMRPSILESLKIWGAYTGDTVVRTTLPFGFIRRRMAFPAR